MDICWERKGYELSEKVGSYGRLQYWRGMRSKDKLAVFFKIFQDKDHSVHESGLLKHVFEITKELQHPGILKTCAYFKENGYQILVTEDRGESLEKSISETELALEDVLDIALALCASLAYLHEEQIIHKNICPASIIYDLKNGVFISGFEFASRLLQQNIPLKTPGAFECDLRYISPEQTGRMNRAIDYRSDYYSLGVTLYELLTGRPPFISDDSVELIHSHIALKPMPVDEVRQLPPAISKIVMKLMAKNTEDRYQSLHGLKADLRFCQQTLAAGEEIKDFTPAVHDYSEHFQVHQKLYGRSREIETLTQTFEKIRKGGMELVLVAGYSGVGKSALIREIHKPITANKGQFISGKFDLYQRDIPYFAVAHAFDEFCNFLLMEESAVLDSWRLCIQKVLGSNGQVLIDILPKLELIIGPQPPVIQMGPNEGQTRFNLLFQNFIRSITGPDHPLVLFIDDLQWADHSSLNLLKTMCVDERIGNFLIIGAYRDNEVDPLHPLSLILKEFEKEGKNIPLLHLDNLSFDDVNSLIADTLHRPADEVCPLTAEVYNKTQGNAFFTCEFLKTLYTENLLRFDKTSKVWVWEIKEIKHRDITDNVVDLLVKKMSFMSEDTQDILQWAACIGAYFDLYTLTTISEKGPNSILDDLYPALQTGMIITFDEHYEYIRCASDKEQKRVRFRFVHDRVQQAAYSLIAEKQRKAVHLRLGRLLRAAGDEPENISDIVQQLNMGRDLIVEEQELISLVELNLQLSIKAKDSHASREALQHINICFELLPDNYWEKYPDLGCSLLREKIECEYIEGIHQSIAQDFQLLLEKLVVKEEKANLYNLMVGMYLSQTKFRDALVISSDALAMYDIEIPKNKADYRPWFEKELQTVERLIGDLDVDALAQLPDSEDGEVDIIMSLLSRFWTAAYNFDVDLCNWVGLKMLTVSLNRGYGNCTSFAYVCYATILSHIYEDYENAYSFGQVSMKLIDRFSDDVVMIPKVTNMYAHSISHYKDHLGENLRLYENSYKAAQNCGDLWWGAWALNFSLVSMYLKGDPLDLVKKRSIEFNGFFKRTSDRVLNQFKALIEYIICELQGKNGSQMFMDNGEVFDEEVMLRELKETQFSFGVCYHQTLCSWLAYLQGICLQRTV